jgi:hypothetical protein
MGFELEFRAAAVYLGGAAIRPPFRLPAVVRNPPVDFPGPFRDLAGKDITGPLLRGNFRHIERGPQRRPRGVFQNRSGQYFIHGRVASTAARGSEKEH